MSLPFKDRTDAGRALAHKLSRYSGEPNVVVLALPRGGVPVGFEVARHLKVPLDVFVVRKLGVPGREELALGAIASGGVRVVNRRVLSMVGINEEELDSITEREQTELERRERAYRDGRPPATIQDRIAILVDDGLATGATMRAAAHAVGQLHPMRVIVAAPVCAQEAMEGLRAKVNEIVCAEMPHPFKAVGLWYEHFPQTTDEEVRELLARAAERMR